MRSSLLVRVALIFVLASVLPLALAGFATIGLLQDAARRDAERRHDAIAELAGALVRDAVAGAGDRLTTVSRLLERELNERTPGGYGGWNEGHRATVAKRLDGLVEPADIYLELEYFAVDAQSDLVRGGGATGPARVEGARMFDYGSALAEGAASAGDDAIRSALVQGPIESHALCIAPAPEVRGGFASLGLSSPVSVEDRVVGVLLARYDLRRLEALLATVASDRYEVHLHAADGVEVATAGAVEGETVGRQRPVGSNGWTVEVHESAAAVYGPIDAVRRRALAWTGLAVVLALVLGVVTSVWIVRPVGVLTATAQRMEAGDLSARAGIDRTDEIGRLGAAFDRMAAALQRLDEAKGEFIGSVSHELRTPLTSIRLSIANVTDGVVGPVDERALRTLGRIQGDVDRLIDMVNALLEMARLDAGAVEPALEDTDLADLARRAVTTLSPLAEQRRVEVSVDGAGRARVDPALVHRVVVNLVDNAIKFGPDAGRVVVRVGEGTLSVADRGPGVDGDGLFEKFRQGRQDGVKHGGAGLGLALVRRIVELHGGAIDVAANDAPRGDDEPAREGEGPGAVFAVRFGQAT